MTLKFQYGVGDNEVYTTSSEVDWEDFSRNPQGYLPDPNVHGYDFLEWYPALTIGSRSAIKSISGSLTGNGVDDEPVEFSMTESDVYGYNDLFERGNSWPELKWTAFLDSDTEVWGYIYTIGEKYYAGIYAIAAESDSSDSDSSFSESSDIADVDVPFDEETGTFTCVTSVGTVVLTPTWLSLSGESRGLRSEDLVQVYAAYKKSEEEAEKCILYLKYEDTDGSTRTYETLSYDLGTSWADIEDDIETANYLPSRSFGFWRFTGWSGIPLAGAIETDYSIYATYEPIAFRLPLAWGSDPESELRCQWGQLLPAIQSLPTSENEALNSFFLTDALGKFLIKSHAADGTPEISAVYKAFGGATISAQSGTVPEASCSVSALWKAPILWNTQEDLRAAVGVVPTPFATDSTATIPIDAEDSSNIEINFATGFPDSFTIPIINRNGSSPDYGKTNAGARVITRRMVNTLGNLGSQEQFFQQCGGYHTFDTAICNAIGGYPKTAILRFYEESSNTLRTVYSLQENNYWNFLENGVDGVHWKYIDDNPALAVSVDYADFIDLSTTLFVETGIPDLYEVPFDSWLNLFSFSFCDMNSTEHIESENVPAVYKVEDGVLYKDMLNGGLFTGLDGRVYLDIYNVETNTTNSVLLRSEGSMSYRASMWDKGYNFGMRYCYKQPRYVVGQGSFFLNKGDKIRIRGTYVDIPSALSFDPDIWDQRMVHEMQMTDQEVRRKYLCRHAMLYKVGWRS